MESAARHRIADSSSGPIEGVDGAAFALSALACSMNIEVKAATIERFDDVAIMLGPKNVGSSVCWCLSHRLDSRTNGSSSDLHGAIT